ncbi:hypothetical protein BZZ01_05080 [Nostocales cyanobacterium HT-58-2]|nr:hypothetical protein BZZ01_05080 [Nostocales cyanobacterium HT-58-2]
MPEDKTSYLRKEPPKWVHLPTTPCRYPQSFKPYLDEIARIGDNNSKEFLASLGAIAAWAAEQKNPVEALQQLLQLAQKLDQP